MNGVFQMTSSNSEENVRAICQYLMNMGFLITLCKANKIEFTDNSNGHVILTLPTTLNEKYRLSTSNKCGDLNSIRCDNLFQVVLNILTFQIKMIDKEGEEYIHDVLGKMIVLDVDVITFFRYRINDCCYTFNYKGLLFNLTINPLKKTYEVNLPYIPNENEETLLNELLNVLK